MSSVSTVDFAQAHQAHYGTNINFSLAKVKASPKAPVITITLTTGFGQFIGKGANQKLAKVNAVQKANQHKDCPLLLED
jgi:dsRNA-specific ribonuclease